jgi:hypothetical protein
VLAQALAPFELIQHSRGSVQKEQRRVKGR